MEPAVAAALADITAWVRSRPDARGLALVGSYAAGKAQAGSDVGVVIIADAPEAYRDGQWVQCAVGAATRQERFGNVWSLFATLAEDPEVEFTFAERSWTKADPPALEVFRIVSDGIVILYDPEDELRALCRACGVQPQSIA
jgi:predicted nucleotidyltransferase